MIEKLNEIEQKVIKSTWLNFDRVSKLIYDNKNVLFLDIADRIITNLQMQELENIAKKLNRHITCFIFNEALKNVSFLLVE